MRKFFSRLMLSLSNHEPVEGRFKMRISDIDANIGDVKG